ncbi:MAG: hypothetical protein AAF733_01265 [Verrucomicrobiota bacterium]
MNTWGYLIAISALLLVSALMLYARFAARSREKSLHHAPQDADLLNATLLEAPPAAPVLEDYDEEENPVVGFKPVAPVLVDEEKEDLEPDGSDERYLDDLQEAAAGLAMLMRSSPTRNRSEPVVFQPDNSGEAEELSGESSDSGIESSEEEISPSEAPSLDEALDEIESILDGPTALEMEKGGWERAKVSSERQCLRGILGDDVAERFVHLDDSLDDLESLVNEMEGELSLFDEFLSASNEDSVSAAA